MRNFGYPSCTLQMHWTENWGKKFPERKLCGLNPNFYLQIDFYCTFRRSTCLFRCSNIGGPILGIYKSLTSKQVNRSWEYINRSQMYMNMEIGNKAAQFDICEYTYLNILCSACATKYPEISLVTKLLKLQTHEHPSPLQPPFCLPPTPPPAINCKVRVLLLTFMPQGCASPPPPLSVCTLITPYSP